MQKKPTMSTTIEYNTNSLSLTLFVDYFITIILIGNGNCTKVNSSFTVKVESAQIIYKQLNF